MKNFSRFLFLGAIVCLSARFAKADNLTLGSFASGATAASLGYSSSQTATTYNGYSASAPVSMATGSASTVALSTNGVWGNIANSNSSWVGVSASASPFAAGASLALGYYQFSTTFTALGGLYNGSISLMADDTAELLINGVVVDPFQSLGADAYCSDNGPNCRTATVIPLNGITLNSGTNTFTFIVEQAGIVSSSDPSGLNFQANLNQQQIDAAPEPNSFFLLGTGMLGGIAAVYSSRFRRRVIA